MSELPALPVEIRETLPLVLQAYLTGLETEVSALQPKG